MRADERNGNGSLKQLLAVLTIGGLLAGAVIWIVSTVTSGENRSEETARKVEESARRDLQIAVTRLEKTVEQVKTDAQQALSNMRAEMGEDSRARDERLTAQIERLNNGVTELKQITARLEASLDVIFEKRKK